MPRRNMGRRSVPLHLCRTRRCSFATEPQRRRMKPNLRHCCLVSFLFRIGGVRDTSADHLAEVSEGLGIRSDGRSLRIARVEFLCTGSKGCRRALSEPTRERISWTACCRACSIESSALGFPSLAALGQEPLYQQPAQPLLAPTGRDALEPLQDQGLEGHARIELQAQPLATGPGGHDQSAPATASERHCRG
jgi:hypothetical protein